MMLYSFFCLFFFFFQAEDGIRDVAVTGVQTCALPILSPSIATDTPNASCEAPSRAMRVACSAQTFALRVNTVADPCSELGRSEERRVGKECRSRWSP